MRAVAAIAAAVLLAAAGPIERVARAAVAVTPGFDDITVKAGLNKAHHNRVFKNPYAHIMAGYTALGASGAAADYDGDGFDDLFVTDSAADGRNHLYHNNHNLTAISPTSRRNPASTPATTRRTPRPIRCGLTSTTTASRICWSSGSGITSCTRTWARGSSRKSRRPAGLDRYLNAITAVAFDYDHDGFVDIFIGAYFRPVNLFNPDTPNFFPENFETANNGGGVIVFRNNGNGTFTDVSEKVGIKISGWTLDLGHGDANNDGWDDLYVACDFGTDRFFVNNRDGTFTDRTESAIGFDTKKGMNAEWGDYDNDGLLDVYVTNITDDYMREGNFLWKNNGNLTFTDVSRETNTYDTGWGWGAKFLDYDNDGWLDLYVTNGWVSAGKEDYVPDIFAMVIKPGIDLADARNWPPMGNKSLSGYQKKRLFHNEKGQAFSDRAAMYGVDSIRDGRGIATADFDNDGRVDMFVANANGDPFFYHNVMTPVGHWAANSP